MAKPRIAIDIKSKLKERGIESQKEEKTEIVEIYQSTFDFALWGIEDKSKIDAITEKEGKIMKVGAQYSENLKEMCCVLNDLKEEFKGTVEGSWMSYYKDSLKLGKDKVSELLKRYSLYKDFPQFEAFISSLSNAAVLELTKKNILTEQREKILKLGISGTREIKEELYSKEEKEPEIHNSIFNYRRDLKKYEKKVEKLNIEEKEMALQELETFEEELKKLIETIKES